MKNIVLGIMTSRRWMLVTLAIPLALIAVSCETKVTTEKSVAATNPNRAVTANPRVTSTDANKPAKASFYTCGMHPQVRSLDPDGKCPICQMPLLPAETVMVVDPDTGKTNNAASFPVISGYYSCPMHPTVLSRDSEAKCPQCGMPLLPVENPVFSQEK
jgi:hypothetical protein